MNQTNPFFLNLLWSRYFMRASVSINRRNWYLKWSITMAELTESNANTGALTYEI